MLAYNIAMLPRPVDRADPLDRGWCFGLPPGIAPEQWPLDPDNGWPLMHGFTLLLPDDYRCHGPEIVALSFFTVPPATEDSRVRASLRPSHRLRCGRTVRSWQPSGSGSSGTILACTGWRGRSGKRRR